MSFDPVSYLMGSKNGGGGGGGGNPNYIETIEGTLANPWGDINYGALVHEIKLRNVTALLTTILPNGTEWIIPIVPYKWYDTSVLTLVASAASPAATGTPIPMFGGCVIYDADPNPHLVQIIASLDDTNYQWVDATSQLSQLPTTLTIINHPMTGSLPMAEKTTFGGTA